LNATYRDKPNGIKDRKSATFFTSSPERNCKTIAEKRGRNNKVKSNIYANLT